MNVTNGSFAIDEKRGGHGLDVRTRDEFLRSIPDYWKGNRHALEKLAHFRSLLVDADAEHREAFRRELLLPLVKHGE